MKYPYQIDPEKRKKKNDYNKEYKKRPYVKDTRHIKSVSKKYKILPYDYEALLREQDGKCAICGKKNGTNTDSKRLCVDHSHTTGKVRGLLCFHCNVAIGHMKESTEFLLKAVDYLSR